MEASKLTDYFIAKNFKFKLPKIMEFRVKVNKPDKNIFHFESQDGTSIVTYSDESILNLKDYTARFMKKLKSKFSYKLNSLKEKQINNKLFIISQGEFKKNKKQFIIYSLFTQIDNKKIVILLTTLKENLKDKKKLYKLFFDTIITYNNNIKTFLYENKNFRLTLPINWKKDSRTEDGFIFKNISLNILPYKKDKFNSFISNYIKKIEKDYSNNIYEKNITKNKVSFKININLKNKIIIISSNFYTKNGKIYLLTIGGPEKKMLTYKKTIKQITESFSIK